MGDKKARNSYIWIQFQFYDGTTTGNSPYLVMRVEDYYVTHFFLYNKNINTPTGLQQFIQIRDPDYGETRDVPYEHSTSSLIAANYIEVTQENIDIPDNSNQFPENFNNNYKENGRKVPTPGRAKRTFFFVFLAEASRFGMMECYKIMQNTIAIFICT